MSERRYVITKLDAGDYLLPSNDGNVLWRIRQYEDGPSYGLEDWPTDKVLWGLWKCTLPKARWERGNVDPDDGDHWDFWEGTYTTRKAAIDGALKAS